MTPGTLDVVNTVSQVGLFLATLGLLYVAYYQVNKIRSQSNADFIARLNREFFYENPTNRKIIKAIEEHQPVFQKNGGEFTEYDIHAYLRYFEMIERFIAGGIVSLDLVDEMFGNYIARAWENGEIQEYVVRNRERRKDKRYLEHFEQLAKKIIATEKEYRA
ncbi:MAG TPA: hypothetical protein VMA75_01905 [Candidatus Paceibacterota bacterium]|nr:hypothetical protein [Candidatus Paceibacterota bacterium]